RCRHSRPTSGSECGHSEIAGFGNRSSCRPRSWLAHPPSGTWWPPPGHSSGSASDKPGGGSRSTASRLAGQSGRKCASGRSSRYKWLLEHR
nr:hypothetical protein [Tanacetum cinerariifolium]